MKFKQINCNGLFRWSPTRHEAGLVIGSTAQQFDTNFSSDNKIDIYSLDIQKSSEDAILRSSKVVTTPFTCMAWHPTALICATQSKTLQFYDTNGSEILLKQETEAQSSGLNCIDLNPKESHTLAIGCDDGSVGVWDLQANAKPERTLNLSASANESINLVKWNRQVFTILAAASNSNVHIWDTRKAANSGPIMRVHDNNAASMWGTGPQSLMISRALAWSESNATSLIVANSNDANPILQLWDLRYATCPLNNFRGGHSRGIQSISWNRYDDQLLLSAGKDNNVCLWNPSTPMNEEPLQAVIPYITNQWINEIEWCDWEPSLFAVNSFDGRTIVYDLTKNNSYIQTNATVLESFSLNSGNLMPQQIQSPVQSQPIVNKAPKWMRSPCRASFGFGGRLISYDVVVTQTATQPPVLHTQHILNIHQVVTDPELISRAEKLENTLNNGNFLDYCHYKISEQLDNENISKAWKLVALHLESDERKQKEALLELMGFGRAAEQVATNHIDQLCNLTNRMTTQMSPVSDSSDSLVDNSLTNDVSEIPLVSPILPDNLQIQTNDQTLGNQINGAILSGDVGSVINKCIQNNNWTEAILLCCFVSPDHTASTLRQYFNHCVTSNTNSWSALLWCIISAQTSTENEAIGIFNDFISKVDLNYWREVLAFILRESDNWEDANTKSIMIDNLAKRLIDQYVDSGAKQWLDAGIYCYIINGDYFNISKFVPFGSHLDRIELSLILQKCTNSEFIVNQLTAHYAKLLAIEGKLDLALKYIDDNEVELKDRIVGNIKPNYRFVTQSQALGRTQKNIPNLNARGYPSRMQTPAPINPQIPANHVMPPPLTNPYSQPAYPSNPPIPSAYPSHPSLSPASFPSHQLPPPPTIRPVPQSTPMPQNYPSIGSQYPNSQPNSTYNPYPGPQVYGDQAFTPQSATPGWNDPPVLNNARHNSFNESQTAMYPTPNTISTPLPVMSEPVEPNVREMSQTRRQSAVSHTSIPEPLSPQNQQIYETFNRLVSQLEQSPNSQAMNIKRKLEDSRHKLETLRSKLGPSGHLSANTLSGLSHIADAINRNDFQTALECHTQLVATTTFGETTSFLPAIKVILHLAQQRMH